MNTLKLNPEWKIGSVHNFIHSCSVSPINKKSLPKELKEIAGFLLRNKILVVNKKGHLKPITVHWDRVFGL